MDVDRDLAAFRVGDHPLRRLDRRVVDRVVLNAETVAEAIAALVKAEVALDR